MSDADGQAGARVAQLQERLNELEIKAAFQEQMVQELNDALIGQNARITELTDALALLQQRFAAAVQEDETSAPPEPPPPHY